MISGIISTLVGGVITSGLFEYVAIGAAILILMAMVLVFIKLREVASDVKETYNGVMQSYYNSDYYIEKSSDNVEFIEYDDEQADNKVHWWDDYDSFVSQEKYQKDSNFINDYSIGNDDLFWDDEEWA